MLVANSLPALNDVTAMELPDIVAEAAKVCPFEYFYAIDLSLFLRCPIYRFISLTIISLTHLVYIFRGLSIVRNFLKLKMLSGLHFFFFLGFIYWYS